MRRKQLLPLLALVLSLIGGPVRTAFAVSLFDIVIDTNALSGVAAQLAFDLIDGDLTVNNTATISNFSTDGTLGTASSSGGVTGTLPGTVTIADTEFFNELLQPLTLGSIISFTLALTENFAGIPDQFSLFLLDDVGSPLFSTTDPLGTDALFVVDITGAAFGDFQAFSPTSSPAATISATPVPEPTSLLLLATALASAAVVRKRKQLGF